MKRSGPDDSPQEFPETGHMTTGEGTEPPQEQTHEEEQPWQPSSETRQGR